MTSDKNALWQNERSWVPTMGATTLTARTPAAEAVWAKKQNNQVQIGATRLFLPQNVNAEPNQKKHRKKLQQFERIDRLHK